MQSRGSWRCLLLEIIPWHDPVSNTGHAEKCSAHSPLQSRISAGFLILVRKRTSVCSLPAGDAASPWRMSLGNQSLPFVPKTGQARGAEVT